ncbi:unnamed protein product [Cochlearia groenlandica]
MMKKKKQSRSQPKKPLEPSSDSSPSPRLLSMLRSKLASGKDLRHMFRGTKSKTAPGLSSQSRIVRCPKCHKLLQEPIDATIYKCSGCDSVLQAKRWEIEGNDNRIPEALLLSQNRSLSNHVESGSKTPMRSTHREYNPRESPSVERGYHSETVYKHETSDIRREWMRRADEFSETGDSDVFASARRSPYNSRSNASEWTKHERRYKDLPRIPFYPASPSLSSAYEYGYTSPFHGSQVSASEKSYYHHQQPNQFSQYERDGWFQESSTASPTRFSGDGKYNHWSSQLNDIQYQNLYEPSSSATPHRSVYSEHSYQTAAAPDRSTYSKSEASSVKSSVRDKKKYVKEKNPVVKRYVLPTAGGAPFATCSYCLELLHLPQVSPLGRQKRYQVRCGSCSGVLKFSVREKADTVLESPSFVNSGTGFADENVTNHQDSALEGHEEINPDDSHLSSSENGSGDAICKSNDVVIFSPSLETSEDEMTKENIRSISNKLLDLELEPLQPQWKPLLNGKLREQQPESCEIIGIGETSEKSSEKDNNIPERVECDVEESGYKKKQIVKLEEMFGDGSGESLEVTAYKNERMSESSEEPERVVERPLSNSVESLYKNEFDWEETQTNEEFGGESTLEEIVGDKPRMHLKKSQHCGDFICGSSSSDGETYKDTSVKEEEEHMSNTFSDVIPSTPQKSLATKNQIFIEHLDQSSLATVLISRVHEEQSKFEYENSSERQELNKTISDKVRNELEESRNETNETLEPGKMSEDGPVDFLETETKTFETVVEGEKGEEQSVSYQINSPNNNVENSYDRLEPVYLKGSEYAGERTWTETMGDRAGLHLEEFESNYENYSKSFEQTSEEAPTFQMHEYELETILEPEEETQGRSRGSFDDHESSEDSAVLHESRDATPDQSQYEYYDNSGEVNETAMQLEENQNDPHKWTTERASTFRLNEYELGTMPDIFNDSERSKERLAAHEEEEPWLLDENKTEDLKVGIAVKAGPFKWTERTPTLSIYATKRGTMLEPDEDVDEKSESSSTGSFNNHESSKVRNVFHEEELELVNDSRTELLQKDKVSSLDLEKVENESIKLEETFGWASERPPTFRLHEYELDTTLELNEDADNRAIQVSEMAKDTVSLHIEESKTESMEMDETFEWTSERALTFRFHGYELGTTMLEQDKDANVRSESSLRGSFNNHGSIEERDVNDEDEDWLVNDYETKAVRAAAISEYGHDKQENLRPILKQGDIEEDITELGSSVSSEDKESQSKTAKIDSEYEDEISRDYLENLQKENEKSRLTSSPYANLSNTTEPSEIVGLRHALYQTQTSPLRSPLSSPIHTPIGSPLHYMMRSPIASPMHSHIVSPLRSPINTTGSLSDVLFFGKKASS